MKVRVTNAAGVSKNISMTKVVLVALGVTVVTLGAVLLKTQKS